MEVEIVSREMVKPAKPTPPHLRTYEVSLIDQFSPSSYVPFILFYETNKFEDAQTLFQQLKASFSEVLAVYYPLSGRFKDAATIDCNDEGGLFVEAKVNNYSLSGFLKNPDIQTLNDFLPSKGNGLEKNPIPHVAVKVTQFEYGGLVIGACLFHKVVDAKATCVFLNNWAKMTRGESIVEPDFTAASSLFPPRASLSNDFVRNFDNFFFQGTQSYMRRYLFDENAVKALRGKASSEKVPNPTRVEALSAFVAERMAEAYCKAAKPGTSFTSLMVTHPVNLRQRKEPPLPDNTFGNVIWLAFAFYELDSSNNKIDLADLAALLREAFESMSKESLAELDMDDAFDALNDLLESLYTNENIKICRFTSFCNMGVYDIDFGWGKPCWVAHMGDMVDYRSKQQFVLIEAINGKGLELWLASDEAELSVLEKDPGFLEFAIPNPAISV